MKKYTGSDAIIENLNNYLARLYEVKMIAAAKKDAAIAVNVSKVITWSTLIASCVDVFCFVIVCARFKFTILFI